MFKAIVSLALIGSAALAFDRDGARTMTTYVKMTDGARLHTRVSFPRDYKDGDRRAVIMDRSPYGQFGIELLSDLFLPGGFITVAQDMRGTGLSMGHFSNWKADANDSLVTGNWVVEQPWSNGEIHLFGASADGLGAFTTNYNSPSWLQSQYYIWTSSIGYEVIYPNGAQLYNLLHRWLSGTVREDDFERCWGEFIENEAKTTWWDDLNFQGHYDMVKRGDFGFWAGWYDIFLVGTLDAYNGYNSQSEPEARHTSRLLIDPCGHCQDAAPFFTEDVIAGRTALGLMQAYETFGVRPVKRPNIKNITFYVMSSNDEAGRAAGQFWTTLESWPRTNPTRFYLHGDGSVSTTHPLSTDGQKDSTSYVHDPANPIGTKGGNNLFSDAPCGPLDQQEIDRRSDVITFQTPALTEELVMTGAINGYLYVSSSAIDTDVMVRVSDVYPNGEAHLIQDSAVRMRWRQGGTTPVFMEKDVVYPAYITLWNTSYVVAPGHSLRFALSSSNYPRFSVNPNNGLLLNDPSYPGENVVATNTIHHSQKFPTYFELPIVKKAQLPQVHDLKAEFTAAYPQVDYDRVMEKAPALFERMNRMAL